MPPTCSEGRNRLIAIAGAATPAPTSRNVASGSSVRAVRSSPRAGTTKRRRHDRHAESVSVANG